MFYAKPANTRRPNSADMAVFPIGRTGLHCPHPRHRSCGDPVLRLEFLHPTVMDPFLVFAAAMGPEHRDGLYGLISLGTGAFMGVGAFACYKLTTYFPNVNIIIWILASGVFSAAIGALFGLPSLRIKGSTSRWRRWRRSSF